jgi:hypothetical protein
VNGITLNTRGFQSRRMDGLPAQNIQFWIKLSWPTGLSMSAKDSLHTGAKTAPLGGDIPTK